MTAKKLPLPGIDPEQKAERDRRWIEELDPQTETQAQLSQRVLTAADQRDCCDLFFAQTIASQVQTADDRFDQELEDSFIQGKRLFQTDPAQAVAILSQTSLGCQWLLKRKSELRERLITHGFLLNSDIREWLALNGETQEKVPSNDYVSMKERTPLGFVVNFHGFMSQPVDGPRSTGSRCLFGVPNTARPALMEKWKDPKDNVAVLLRMLDAEIAELQERLATLSGREQRRRPAAAAQALLINPPPKGAPWHRYSQDADRALYQALQEYWAEKAREAARQAEAAAEKGESAAEAESPPPEAACEPAVGAAKDVPGNEPGAAAVDDVNSCDDMAYAADPGLAWDLPEGLGDPAYAAGIAAMTPPTLNRPSGG
jgi:hypothetical protein